MSSMFYPVSFGTRHAAPLRRVSMRRGRPVLRVVPPKYPNRLGELRARRGLTQERLSELSGISVQHISSLERGEKQIIPTPTGRALARALQCSLAELLGDASRESVPLRYTVAAHFSAGRPDCFEFAPPYAMLTMGAAHDEGCFAAEVFDDSAAPKFPPGSILYFRPIQTGETLRPGMQVLIRFCDGSETREILFGVLDISLAGDLFLVLRSPNPVLPGLLTVQRAQPAHALAESQALMRPIAVPYQIAEDAFGIILGELIWVGRSP